MSDDRETPPPSPDNPFDAWLASAPARLEPPDVVACPACGAQLGGGEVEPIPGVTVVDPEVGRRVRPVKAPSGTGVFAWLTGDGDLVDAVVTPDPSAPAATAELGTASPGAVAPPDRRLRREMARIGSAPPDDAGVDAGTGAAGAATEAVEDAADAPAAGTDVDAEAASAQGDPAGPDAAR
jgi:hypothetical protein